ncbi:MAG: hypothetical protein JWQ98_2702 [Chlorobi bacterium]|nr:hypothetical protein [Chlorobiota bacterium]
MPRSFCLVKLLLGILLTYLPASSQDSARHRGVFSVNGSVGQLEAQLGAMNGGMYAFEEDIVGRGWLRTYPFNIFEYVGVGAQIGYRLMDSRFGLLLSYTWSQHSDFLDKDTVFLTFETFTLGGDYCIGDQRDHWNLFLKAGGNISVFNGRTKSQLFPDTLYRVMNPAVRVGLETEVGGRYNFIGIPLAIEIGFNYTNANIIGSRFERTSIGLIGSELNDGPNPDDPSDRKRVIATLIFKSGIRIWI